jgi:hypothetical protein
MRSRPYAYCIPRQESAVRGIDGLNDAIHLCACFLFTKKDAATCYATFRTAGQQTHHDRVRQVKTWYQGSKRTHQGNTSPRNPL